jgi:hypothetical protein
MRHFGVLKIVQSDNRGEFKGILEGLLWEQGIQIIPGRPKHPQSKGLPEQGNFVAKRKLEFWQAKNKNFELGKSTSVYCPSHE